MAKLSAGTRNRLPSSDFAGPNRSFPDEDLSHARFALSMAGHAPNPAAVRAKVHRDWPSIGGGGRVGSGGELHKALMGAMGKV